MPKISKPRRQRMPKSSRRSCLLEKNAMPETGFPSLELSLLSSQMEDFQRIHTTIIEITKKSLMACLQAHQPGCPSYLGAFLPTRLIDLEVLTSPRLVLSSNSSLSDRRYVCLSHRWGSPESSMQSVMTTTTRNVESKMKMIEFGTLPRHYQNAMILCHLMGVRYIWIDSLCILQVSLHTLFV